MCIDTTRLEADKKWAQTLLSMSEKMIAIDDERLAIDINMAAAEAPNPVVQSEGIISSFLFCVMISCILGFTPIQIVHQRRIVVEAAAWKLKKWTPYLRALAW